MTDGVYMEHLHCSISDVGWIIQDRTTGKRVQGSLAEWPAAARSYREELLGMLVVRIFLLTAKD